MKKIIYIAIFAFIGGALRESLTLLAGNQHALMTILINVTGSFALAYLTSYLPSLPVIDDDMMVGISVGLIGSYTTFSTFSVDTIKLFSQPIWAITYIIVSLVGGYLAVLLGHFLGNRQIIKGQE